MGYFMKIKFKNIKHTLTQNNRNKHKYRHNQELKTNCDTALLSNIRRGVHELEGEKG